MHTSTSSSKGSCFSPPPWPSPPVPCPNPTGSLTCSKISQVSVVLACHVSFYRCSTTSVCDCVHVQNHAEDYYLALLCCQLHCDVPDDTWSILLACKSYFFFCRFAPHPLVTGPPYVRFHAAAPLISSMGHRLGSL